jgi:hypothetical protein
MTVAEVEGPAFTTDDADDLGTIMDYLAPGGDELTALRGRYWWFAITRTRRGWTAMPLWLLDQPGERVVADSASDLEAELRQRVAALAMLI